MAFIEIGIEKAREKPGIKMVSFTAHLYNDNKYSYKAFINYQIAIYYS